MCETSPCQAQDSSESIPAPQASIAAQAPRHVVEKLDRIAGKLYNLAAMLVGEGELCARLVERAIADSEVSICESLHAAQQSSIRVLCREAVAELASRDPENFAVPQIKPKHGCCLSDEEQKAAEVAPEALEALLSGPERARVRAWLDQLPVVARTVFVLRTIAGLSVAETAEILIAQGGPKAAGWQQESVHEAFRAGLCPLTAHLLQAAQKSGVSAS